MFTTRRQSKISLLFPRGWPAHHWTFGAKSFGDVANESKTDEGEIDVFASAKSSEQLLQEAA